MCVCVCVYERGACVAYSKTPCRPTLAYELEPAEQEGLH
jgi:hypothetical protein